MTVRGSGHRLGDHHGDGLGPQEVGGVVLTALVRDELALHVGIGAARVDRGDAQRGLVLRPTSDASFESLTLWLDPKSLQLRESVVVDLFGNRTRVRFADIVENAGVEPAAFEFAAPAGTDVIDLR